MPVEITTNNVPRDVIESWQLTENERKEFDFIDWENVLGDNPQSLPQFFRYKGELYYLETAEGKLPTDPKWYYISQGFSFGIVFRYPQFADGTYDFDSVVVGRYYCS